MLGQVQAREHGCQQVVWLDAAEKSYVEELGAMNLFFVFGEGDDCEIVTPPLSDTILPGITRRSVLAIGDDLGLAVSERRVSLADWQQLCSESKITETFATGTAAGLTPVRKVKSMSGEWTVGTSYPITSRIADHLNAIQSGARDDQHEWMQHL
jgi:branched-chain amino acid aminotransferase